MPTDTTTRCTACGHPNESGSKFCTQCGTRLGMSCPACGASAAPGSAFCGECGARLTEARPPAPQIAVETVSVAAPATPVPRNPAVPVVEKERRLVTILFADMVGSTELGERYDPEIVDELISLFQASCRTIVERYGGHVLKFTGDGLMALFGAPIAREDDAERAVLAALAIQTAIGEVNEQRPADMVPLDVRVGITSGEVVAGAQSGQYDVIGDAANTAARLESSAPAGGVLVGEETMRLTRRRFSFGPREALSLKGKANLVPAYTVLGTRERGERWEIESRAPLVGRDRELEMLLAQWEAARAGNGRLVSIVADAGVGKSRLVAELADRVIAGEGAAMLRVRCVSYGQELPLRAVIDLLRALCGAGEDESLEALRTKLAAVADLLPPGEPRMQALDVLGEAMGLPPTESSVSGADPQIRRQILIRSVVDVLRMVTLRGPILLDLEDVHWSDDASRDVLGDLLPQLRPLPLLAVVTHRPGFAAPWDSWDWVSHLVLEPLPADFALALARAVLGGSPVTADLAAQVTERAGGNPFFIEELLRSLRDAGELIDQDGRIGLVPGAAARMPATLVEVLLARLDRLSGGARSTAQTSSVVGRSFRTPVLARATGLDAPALAGPLGELQSAELVLAEGSEDVEYTFKHATIHEVTYNTLLIKRRQELHGVIARALLDLYPVDEQVDLLAYHFAQTAEHAEAARWLERSGDRAAAIYANSAAIEQYRAARTRCEQAGNDREALGRIDEKLGRVLRTAARYDEALEALDRAAAADREIGDLEGERRVVAEIGRVHRARGTATEGLARVDALLDMLPEADPSPGLAALYVARARLLYSAGQYREQLPAAERGATLAGLIGDRQLLGEAEMSRGAATLRLGFPKDALTIFESAVPIAEEVRDFATLNILLVNAAVTYAQLGLLARSRDAYDRSYEVAVRTGDPANMAFSLASLGYIDYWMGEWERARRENDEAVEMVRGLGSSWYATYPLVLRGQLLTALGEWQGAERDLAEAIGIARQACDLQGLWWGSYLLAELDLLRGDPGQALTRFEGLFDPPERLRDATPVLPTLASTYLELGDIPEAERITALAVQQAEDENGVIDLLHAHRIEGMVAARTGRHDEAIRIFTAGVEEARRVGYPYAEARLLYELGLVRQEERDETLRAALTIFRRLGATPYRALTEQALSTR